MTMVERPQGEPARGPMGISRDSMWLTNEDLPHDRDVVVEIEKVMLYRNVKFQGGRTKPAYHALKFVGKERELGLNSTNKQALAKLFGSKQAEDYYGRRIVLYVQQGVRYPTGEEGPAVRIRPFLPPEAPDAPEDQAAEDAEVPSEHDEIDAEFDKAAGEAADAEGRDE